MILDLLCSKFIPLFSLLKKKKKERKRKKQKVRKWQIMYIHTHTFLSVNYLYYPEESIIAHECLRAYPSIVKSRENIHNFIWCNKLLSGIIPYIFSNKSNYQFPIEMYLSLKNSLGVINFLFSYSKYKACKFCLFIWWTPM